MNPETWLVYATTVLILMSTPGPSHLLMLSNSISCGFRRSVFTAAGDLTANFLQMIVAALGLVSIITTSREFFLWIKWAGVLYLVWLGLKLLLKRPATSVGASEQNRSRHECVGPRMELPELSVRHTVGRRHIEVLTVRRDAQTVRPLGLDRDLSDRRRLIDGHSGCVESYAVNQIGRFGSDVDVVCRVRGLTDREGRTVGRSAPTRGAGGQGDRGREDGGGA